MAITILTKPRKYERDFLTYDLEWIPGTLQVRLVGVFDGYQYRCYTTIEAFILNELTHKNRGKWFYAHAGGLADFQFVLEQIAIESGFSYDEIGGLSHRGWAQKGFKVRGSFSGSSAIIVHVTRGKNSWHFVDSYWLLRDTLRNIGKWVGIPKGNKDECVKFYSEASFNELRKYNEVDCVILYKAIRSFEQVLLELGGQLKMTQASCAMELFRRRFLKADIDTSYAVNETARESYFASRVEVFMKECRDAYYYDINSSFPYAMTYEVPGEFIGQFNRRLPSDAKIFLADCTVEVPDSYMPPLPVRRKGRIFFPTGRWRNWYTNVDLRLLLENGGRILNVHSSLAFEPCSDLRDYANTLFDLRKDAPSDSFEKLAYKYLLNSLYGKFAESEWKSGFVLNPPSPHMDKPGWTMLFPGAFLFEQEVPIPHMHVPISTHITSIARRTIYNYMGSSTQVHYCDTDGFSTDTEFSVTGKQLGAIKLEKIVRKGIFYQAKVYMLDGEDVDGNDLLTSKSDKCGWCGDIHEEAVPGVKAKGFSRMTLSKLEKLAMGEEVEYTRMRRIKELIRSGNLQPKESIIRKRLNQDGIPKRFFYPDGQSRPWNIEELEDIL